MYNNVINYLISNKIGFIITEDCFYIKFMDIRLKINSKKRGKYQKHLYKDICKSSNKYFYYCENLHLSTQFIKKIDFIKYIFYNYCKEVENIILDDIHYIFYTLKPNLLVELIDIFKYSNIKYINTGVEIFVSAKSLFKYIGYINTHVSVKVNTIQTDILYFKDFDDLDNVIETNILFLNDIKMHKNSILLNFAGIIRVLLRSKIKNSNKEMLKSHILKSLSV